MTMTEPGVRTAVEATAEEASEKKLQDAAYEAKGAWHHTFKAMPWPEAFRHLTELTIAAIQAERIANEADEDDLSEVLVELGCLAGSNAAVLWGDEPTRIVLADADFTVWEVWISLATTMAAHYTGGGIRRGECICR